MSDDKKLKDEQVKDVTGGAYYNVKLEQGTASQKDELWPFKAAGTEGNIMYTNIVQGTLPDDQTKFDWSLNQEVIKKRGED